MPDLVRALAAVRRDSRTKIVATIGPASEAPHTLAQLIRAGVDVCRINTAHGTPEDHVRLLEAVRHVERETGHPVAVLVDLAGPKMRLGELPGGELQFRAGDEVRFVRGETAAQPGELVCTYPTLLDELQAGDRIMLADGTVALTIERVEPNAAVCRVQQGGTVRSRQGVNLPGVRLRAPALGDRDREAALWAAQAGADFLGLSFVRTAADIEELRTLLAPLKSSTQIVAKIEKPEALESLEAIIAASDAVMVARGDLGVEIDIARIAVVQKQIVAACRRAGRPVIIATQMLDSMHRSRLPTRAEATDVANAILDGADACMLSGETAIGEYPLEAVEMMHRIAVKTEPHIEGCDAQPRHGYANGNSVTATTTAAAAQIAERLAAKLIVVASATPGQSALALSRTRTLVPMIGVSPSIDSLRHMALYWGIIPLKDTPRDDAALYRFVVERGRAAGALEAGDRIVFVTGGNEGSGGHSTITIHEVI